MNSVQIVDVLTALDTAAESVEQARVLLIDALAGRHSAPPEQWPNASSWVAEHWPPATPVAKMAIVKHRDTEPSARAITELPPVVRDSDPRSEPPAYSPRFRLVPCSRCRGPVQVAAELPNTSVLCGRCQRELSP